MFLQNFEAFLQTLKFTGCWLLIGNLDVKKGCEEHPRTPLVHYTKVSNLKILFSSAAVSLPHCIEAIHKLQISK